MDHKDNLEVQQPKVYFDVQKQALLVQPLNQYNTLAEEVNDSIINQISIYVNELKELEMGKDPEHALAMVVYEEGGTMKVEEKKRGRQAKNLVIGSILVSFDLPQFCYKRDIDIERIFATCPPKKDNSKKEVLVTPLKDRKFSLKKRAKNWRIKLSKRSDNLRHDVYSTHLPSNTKFRSKCEMINFILYEAPPNINYNKKRKSAELATKCDAMTSSTSKVPDKKRKMCSTNAKPAEKKEWFSKEKKNDTDGVAKPAEKKKEYLEILEELQMHLSRLMIHEIKEFIDAPIDLNFQMYIKGT